MNCIQSEYYLLLLSFQCPDPPCCTKSTVDPINPYVEDRINKMEEDMARSGKENENKASTLR